MNEKKKKGLPIGYEDFKEVIDESLYFVDKTQMIEELVNSSSKNMLLTRPRRFGKTLNLSMLRRFFEDERTMQGKKIRNRYLFDGLAVSQCGKEILQHQERYPLINLSLKSAKQPDYEMAYGSLIDEIAKEFKRHIYVLETEQLTPAQKQRFLRIMEHEAERVEYAKSLSFLSECLALYHGKNVFILIDEYDVPLESSWLGGFYEQMTAFIRSLLESGLKTNPYLERGILTGCLRISRESIFTGLNNLEVHSLLSPYYCDKFGFTQTEVRELLEYYRLSDKYAELKKWYDGYRFSGIEIYNPWSILNYVKMALADRNFFPKPYWSNTSSNHIVREMIEKADEETRSELERLMDGGVIEKPIHEEITYGDIDESQDNLWNFLFFTGYLTAEGQRQENRRSYLKMFIPNEEIACIYEDSICSWFTQKIEDLDRSPLICALEEGDCKTAEAFISQQLMDTISYYDYAESYYHGFLAGILKGSGRYKVVSNRETGTGRADLVLQEKKFMGKAIVLEFKVARQIERMEEGCEAALAQIERNHYTGPLQEEGCSPILTYGICFFKKGCRVKAGKGLWL